MGYLYGEKASAPTRTLSKPLGVFLFSGGGFQAHSHAHGVRVSAVLVHPEFKPISAAWQLTSLPFYRRELQRFSEKKKKKNEKKKELRVGWEWWEGAEASHRWVLSGNSSAWAPAGGCGADVSALSCRDAPDDAACHDSIGEACTRTHLAFFHASGWGGMLPPSVINESICFVFERRTGV